MTPLPIPLTGAGRAGSARYPAAPTLSVVIPCYNERPNVAPMIARLDAALAGIAWEAIYVDDDSPDGTAAEVRRIAPDRPAGALHPPDRPPRPGLGGDRGRRWPPPPPSSR